MELENELKETSQSDSGALGAAVVAATVAILFQPGPFGWLAPVIGGTVMLLVLAFDASKTRTWPQSATFACVLAICFLLPAGSVLEFILGSGSLAGLPGPDGKPESRVSDLILLRVWSVTAVLVFAWDMVVQKCRTSGRGERENV